jgi:hypothetical protein
MPATMSTDWKVRYDALGAIATFVQANHVQMQERPVLQPFLDTMSDRCREGNSKVACLALNHLCQMIPLFRVGRAFPCWCLCWC